MITALYLIFLVSLLAPTYTYAAYPILLKLFRAKKYNIDDLYEPQVSIIVYGKPSDEKKNSLCCLDYPKEKIDILFCEDNVSSLNAILEVTSGDVVLFTDCETPLDRLSVKKLVRHFGDKRVGCVVGQLRSESPSAFWKYENYVRANEGKIGRVSGANKAIFAVKKENVTVIPVQIINLDFYVVTSVQQSGYDICFENESVAFEKPGEQGDHVRDGAGYFQAFCLFWKMLLPRKGSFVYWSHRVMKWFVPLNMFLLLASSAMLSFSSPFMLLTFILQLIMYLTVYLFHKFSSGFSCNKGMLNRLLSLLDYFVQLNLSLVRGMVCYLTGKSFQKKGQ